MPSSYSLSTHDAILVMDDMLICCRVNINGKTQLPTTLPSYLNFLTTMQVELK